MAQCGRKQNLAWCCLERKCIVLNLTRGQVALISPESWNLANQVKWYANFFKRRNKYIPMGRLPITITHLPGMDSSNKNNRQVMLYRYIIQCKNNQQIDHINHDTLDNRLENLRFCSDQENNRHIIKRKGTYTSKYIGVSLYKNIVAHKKSPWRVSLRTGNFTYNWGRRTEEEAAMTRDILAIKHFGEYAILNFPEKLEEYKKIIDSETKE